jgi:uncharacterized protein (TIGR02246 family)
MTRIVNQLLFAACLLFSVTLSFASDKSDVEKAYQQWCAAIGEAKGDASVVVKYYAPDAILLPTLSAKILQNTDGGLNAYFKDLTGKKNIKCTPEKLITRLYGDTMAINAGLYDFSFTDKDGKKQVLPARFSFVYEKQNQQWMIVNHHSSKLP